MEGGGVGRGMQGGCGVGSEMVNVIVQQSVEFKEFALATI